MTYMKVDKPQPLVLFEVAKGMVTGKPPQIGEKRQVSGSELRAVKLLDVAGR